MRQRYRRLFDFRFDQRSSPAAKSMNNLKLNARGITAAGVIAAAAMATICAVALFVAIMIVVNRPGGDARTASGPFSGAPLSDALASGQTAIPIPLQAAPTGVPSLILLRNKDYQ